MTKQNSAIYFLVNSDKSLFVISQVFPPILTSSNPMAAAQFDFNESFWISINEHAGNVTWKSLIDILNAPLNKINSDNNCFQIRQFQNVKSFLKELFYTPNYCDKPQCSIKNIDTSASLKINQQSIQEAISTLSASEEILIKKRNTHFDEQKNSYQISIPNVFLKEVMGSFCVLLEAKDRYINLVTHVHVGLFNQHIKIDCPLMNDEVIDKPISELCSFLDKASFKKTQIIEHKEEKS